MFKARRTPKAAYVGAIATALIVAVGLALAAPASVLVVSPVPAPMPAAVQVAEADPTATGSVDSAPASGLKQAMPALPGGSSGFQDALALVNNKQFADAFVAASGLTSDVERRTIQWAAIYNGNGAIDYRSVETFLADAPDFANTGVFKTRTEQALIKADAPGDVIIKALGGAMPNTFAAQLALAESYNSAGEKDRAARIARAIWTGDFLTKAEEDKLLATLGGLLTPADHWLRAEHLMMNDRASAVERLLPFMTPAQKSLAVARKAVSRNATDAKKLLDGVDPAFRTNPIYLFSRAERARQFELWDDAIAYLNKGKPTDIDAEQWWYERQTLVRQLLSAGDPARAYKAAAAYTEGPEGRLVEARFHAGWIALSFLRDAKAAVPQFEAMAKLSTLPDSVAQANYWLGRARAAAGDAAGAKTAYTTAAGYGTIYYGLLSRQALGLKAVELRATPKADDSEIAFNSRDVVQGIGLLVSNHQPGLAAALLRTLTNSLSSGGEFVLAARLAQTVDAHHLAISIADIADKRGFPLDLFSFPKDGLPTGKLAEIDMAAIYAVTRTESRFQTDAVSSSGALGLMQLMPATAKETAKKLGVSYSSAKLTSDGAYNAQLGSSYLATQLGRYNGSLVLAAAAYNAGAGNADKWIAAFGDPRNSNVDPVVWVELIPFQETRKYVQRVLGNYMVYRSRLGGSEIKLSDALHSIG